MQIGWSFINSFPPPISLRHDKDIFSVTRITTMPKDKIKLSLLLDSIVTPVNYFCGHINISLTCFSLRKCPKQGCFSVVIKWL